jgi:CRISPR-associated endoribonuclease Cas6
MLRLKCIYSVIIETPIPEEHPDYRKYKNAPHPYVIIPPLTTRRYFRPDDSIFFDIVLIGRANEYLPYFIYTFIEMGRIGIGEKRGKFSVESVEALNLNGMSEKIFNYVNGVLRVSNNRIDYTLFEKNESPDNEITISFETPVRMKIKDKLSSHIPFHLLISRLSERAFLLAHLHCGGEMGDFEGFAKGSEKVETISSNLRWIDWERYSTRQQTRMKFGGWIGDITYKGDFQKYLPLLRIGEYIHVGKAATFGLGKYRIK